MVSSLAFTWLRENCYALGCTGCHINEATMFAKEQQKRTDYTVKKVETIAAGKDVQARLLT
jgi:hypothetical protein